MALSTALASQLGSSVSRLIQVSTQSNISAHPVALGWCHSQVVKPADFAVNLARVSPESFRAQSPRISLMTNLSNLSPGLYCIMNRVSKYAQELGSKEIGVF